MLQPLQSLTTTRAAGQALAWLLTYAVHSTLLLAMAWGVTRRMGGRRLRLQEALWRCALAGALVTASAQLALANLGLLPAAGRWAIVLPDAPAVSVKEASPGSGAAGSAAKALGLPGGPGFGATGSAAKAPGALGAPGSSVVGHGGSSAMRQAADRAAAGQGAGLAGSRPRATRDRSGQPALRASGGLVAAKWALPAAGVSRSAEPAWLPRLEPWLLGAWLLGALVLTLGTVRSYLSLRRRLRYRPQVVGGGVLARLALLVHGSGVSRRVRLTCTWRLRVPVALGLREAEVCVPPRVLFQLDDEQQDALLAHELAHLVRRDPIWLPLTQLMAGVFFFQPLNWVARRRLRELSELLCDEWAVSRTGRPLSLAACLAEVAAWSLSALGANAGPRRPASLPVPGMADRPSQLAHRIRRLLDGGSPDGRGPDGRRLALVLGSVLLAVTLAAPGIHAGSSAAAPASARAGGGAPAVTSMATAGAGVRQGIAPSVTADAMVVAAMAMTPALEQRAAAAGTAPYADTGYAAYGYVDQGGESAASGPAEAPSSGSTPAAPPTSPGGAASPESGASADAAAPPERDAEQRRLVAAAGRLEQLDKLSNLSQEQLAAITAAVERITREIDGRLGAELEHLKHLSSVHGTGPHREDLPAAELAELDAELAGVTARLHPSAKEMAELDARLRQLDTQLPHLSAEEMKRFQAEAKRAFEKMPKAGLSQAEIDRLHAEMSRALEQMPKSGLSHEDIEHLRADVERVAKESAAAWSHGLSPAEREKLVADARRLAEGVRPDQAQLEALRALQHEHEELSRLLADQRAEIEAARREILQQTEALRDQSRRLTESHRLHSKAKPDRHSPPAAPPAPPASPAPAPAAPPAPRVSAAPPVPAAPPAPIGPPAAAPPAAAPPSPPPA